ncbi:MAG TPA: IS5 family transposase, partial [Bacteroidales bacterium]|nr:IS5 family transposase [Bacteroidales bacterium]
MQEKMAKAQKSRASKHPYVSPTQMTIEGFESPFLQSLDMRNRWVILAHQIPWDLLVSTYQAQMNNSQTGADGINPRVAIGAMILKHMCNMSDRETVLQIQENMYMQYFIGYSSFSTEEPFDPSLFVEFRKRMGIEQINSINEKILGLSKSDSSKDTDNTNDPEHYDCDNTKDEEPLHHETSITEKAITHKGKLITDATACPQNIAYPTDLNLLNDAREKSEELIDELYSQKLHEKKPRTYRKIARKNYLRTAQKKVKSKREIHNAIKKQLSYLRRNLKSINKLLDAYTEIPLDPRQHKYLFVINTLYEQQQKMFEEKTHSIEHRIVSIHQPHVRPIVRGKTNANVEFGAKINVSLMNGFAFLDDLSWDAFNEGTRLMASVEKYKKLFGYYPEEVLVDKIYCNRSNRAALKLLGIKLRAKPLGRPTAVDVEHVRPGERNPIEGKFGQAKTAYGMNLIKARLQQTSESWIATIVLVLNLIKFIGQSAYCQIFSVITYSAILMKLAMSLIKKKISIRLYYFNLKYALT